MMMMLVIKSLKMTTKKRPPTSIMTMEAATAAMVEEVMVMTTTTTNLSLINGVRVKRIRGTIGGKSKALFSVRRILSVHILYPLKVISISPVLDINLREIGTANLKTTPNNFSVISVSKIRSLVEMTKRWTMMMRMKTMMKRKSHPNEARAKRRPLHEKVANRLHHHPRRMFLLRALKIRNLVWRILILLINRISLNECILLLLLLLLTTMMDFSLNCG